MPTSFDVAWGCLAHDDMRERGVMRARALGISPHTNVDPSTGLLTFVGVLVLCTLLGCRQPEANQANAHKDGDRQTSSARQTAHERQNTAERSRPSSEQESASLVRVVTPIPLDSMPAPDTICGHAIAFVGWRQDLEDDSERLFFFDPADNGLEIGRHENRWGADPAESPVYFGKRRPAVILEPAGAFTVCGAVTMIPRGDATTSEPVDSIADVMPDLSQVLGDKWPGLCGPTSAADVIYAIGSRRKALVDGLPRGPSREADAAAIQLIIGGAPAVDALSLAGRMGLRKDGAGVTNNGIRDGLAEWLDHRDPGAWVVELDWFDDQEKTPELQREFFQRLAASVRSGGGAILCLWPGNEFTDDSTAKAADVVDASRAATRSHTASGGIGPSGEASGNEGTAVSSSGDADDEGSSAAGTQPGSTAGQQAHGKGRGFSGSKADARAVEASLQKGLQFITRAQDAKAKGDNAKALHDFGEAISVLRPHAASDSNCRNALARAVEQATALGGDFPQQNTSPSGPTSFE